MSGRISNNPNVQQEIQQKSARDLLYSSDKGIISDPRGTLTAHAASKQSSNTLINIQNSQQEN